MKFCSECGSPVELRIPEGDNRLRHTCPRCATIHYENPKLVIGCIAERNGDVLLCRRAIEPRHGFWTLPAGFMENGETTTQAALRETFEEACAHVEIDDLFSLINVPEIGQVHLFYRGRLRDTNHAAGSESLEVRLFSEADIPWHDLAFQSVELSLKAYFSDRQRGHFRLHEDVLPPFATRHPD